LALGVKKICLRFIGNFANQTEPSKGCLHAAIAVELTTLKPNRAHHLLIDCRLLQATQQTCLGSMKEVSKEVLTLLAAAAEHSTVNQKQRLIFPNSEQFWQFLQLL
jgi:hypothetical protein